LPGGAIGQHGLSPAELARWLEPLAPAIASLQEDYRTRRLPHLRIAEETADLVAAEAALDRLSRGADTIVFFGIGGSSLGGQTLAPLGGWHIPGMASEAQRKRPRTRFYDNLDAVTLEAALGSFNLADTRFIVISKSGGTPETLVQALAALGAVKAAGLEARRLFLGITEPAARQARLAHPVRGARHPHPRSHPGIGGRYSVFTNVGLIAAMARGLDARAVRAAPATWSRR
jgi:glucose-6-phosphate isomerase